MRLLLIPVLLFLASQNGGDAEKLFEQMSRALANADEVHIIADATYQNGKQQGKLRATIRMAKGDRNNSEINAEFNGKAVVMKVVSDGGKMKLTSTFIKEAQVKDTPKGFNANMLGGIQRGGAVMSTMAVDPGGKTRDIADRFKTSEFKLGKKEKIGERDAQALTYKLEMENEPEPIAVQLWLDADTHLPLKRILTGKTRKGDSARIAETYRVLVNPKANPVLYRLTD